MIFFDIDETLVDQRKAEALAAKRFLAFYGQRLDHDYSVPEFCQLWRSLREKHARDFFDGLISFQEQRRRRIGDLFRAREGHLSSAEADARFEIYQEHYRNGWTLFDDVLPCLESLSGYTCGVISNGSTEQQRRKLIETGIESYFAVIVVSEEIGAAKPHPDIFLTACRQARCLAKEAIYVGDRLDLDALASRAAGMQGFWLDRKQTRQQVNVEVIGSLTELCTRLLSE